MIKLFIYTLIAVVTGLLATLFIAREPGYLLIVFAGSRFETSLFALFVAIIAVLILLRLLILILDWINPARLLSAGRSWSRTRAQRRAGAMPVTEQALRDELYEKLAAQLAEDGKGPLTLAELRKYWNKFTKNFVPDHALISRYVDVLIDRDVPSEAAKVLENALQNVASDMLVRQYSLLALRLSDTAATQQLQNAEVWLDSRPNDAQLLLALGRISLRNQQWGKARKYFEASLRKQAGTEAFAELARLLHSLKEQGHSPQFLQEETRLISRALPDFPQPREAQ